MIGRDPSQRAAFAALSAEELRRRASAEAAIPPHHAAEDVEGAGTSGDRRPGRMSTFLAAIRRALGR